MATFNVMNTVSTNPADYANVPTGPYFSPVNPQVSWSGPSLVNAQPAPQQQAPSEPDWLAQWRAEQAAILARQRQSAYDTLTSLFKNFGLDMSSGGLASTIWGWVQQDKSADWIRVNIRNTTEYQRRFPAMQELIKRGQFIDESVYIQQEQMYRQVLRSFDLPEGFYDGPDDYAKFIVNQTSVKELSDRITGAKTFLDSNTSSEYKEALNRMYGVTEGSMLAYVIDADRATPLVQKQIKAAALAGSAVNAGFGDLSQSQAERYGSTLGAQFDAFGTDAKNLLEGEMAKYGVQAANDERLASIDQDSSFIRTDILDAELLNDTEKQLASRKRGQREAARFSGSSAVRTGSLSRNI